MPGIKPVDGWGLPHRKPATEWMGRFGSDVQSGGITLPRDATYALTASACRQSAARRVCPALTCDFSVRLHTSSETTEKPPMQGRAMCYL